MQDVFLAMFLAGVVFATLSFALGFGQAHIHLPHLHLPGLPHLHPGVPHPHGGAEMSAFNLSTVTAFVAWFGGAGYVLASLGELPAALVLLLATASGVLGASVVTVVLVKLLLPGQTAPMRLEDYRIEGTLATVSAPLGGARTGEVRYARHGATRCESARSNDGADLPRGTEVVILRYEKGIAYVEPLEKLLAERTPVTDAPDRALDIRRHDE